MRAFLWWSEERLCTQKVNQALYFFCFCFVFWLPRLLCLRIICSKITDVGLHLKYIHLRFLVNRHSPPRLNHASSSYSHCMINLPSHLITHYSFFKLVILKHQPRDVISGWDLNKQLELRGEWLAKLANQFFSFLATEILLKLKEAMKLNWLMKKSRNFFAVFAWCWCEMLWS